ncbi:hypothetical protein ACHAXN_011614 [Cyclotella atomus]
MKQKVFRPTLDDVERLSLGRSARKRGTGSRSIPHRLNQDERSLYNQAKDANYLIVKGTAYRRERKGSPLCNTFRQRCDALGQVCVVIEKYGGGDVVKIDFSTLRVSRDEVCVDQIMDLLSRKYPEVMKGVSNCCEGSIDLEAIEHNPIWNVEPRLLIVDSISDRVVAKSIAEDVMKESLDSFVVCDNTAGLDELPAENADVKEAVGIGIEQTSVLATDEDEIDISDEIDWDDI